MKSVCTLVSFFVWGCAVQPAVFSDEVALPQIDRSYDNELNSIVPYDSYDSIGGGPGLSLSASAVRYWRFHPSLQNSYAANSYRLVMDSKVHGDGEGCLLVSRLKPPFSEETAPFKTCGKTPLSIVIKHTDLAFCENNPDLTELYSASCDFYLGIVIQHNGRSINYQNIKLQASTNRMSPEYQRLFGSRAQRSILYPSHSFKFEPIGTAIMDSLQFEVTCDDTKSVAFNALPLVLVSTKEFPNIKRSSTYVLSDLGSCNLRVQVDLHHNCRNCSYYLTTASRDGKDHGIRISVKTSVSYSSLPDSPVDPWKREQEAAQERRNAHKVWIDIARLMGCLCILALIIFAVHVYKRCKRTKESIRSEELADMFTRLEDRGSYNHSEE